MAPLTHSAPFLLSCLQADKVSAPEWVPKEASPYVEPALAFLTAQDFDIKTT